MANQIEGFGAVVNEDVAPPQGDDTLDSTRNDYDFQDAECPSAAFRGDCVHLSRTISVTLPEMPKLCEHVPAGDACAPCC